MVEIAFVQQMEIVLLCDAVCPWSAGRDENRGEKEKGDARFEILPVDDKLGHVSHRVFEVEMVPVAVRAWRVAGIKLDAINVVPKL